MLLTSSLLVILVPAEGFKADLSALVELLHTVLQAHLVGRELIGQGVVSLPRLLSLSSRLARQFRLPFTQLSLLLAEVSDLLG